MKSELAQLKPEVISSLILHGDLSKLTPDQRVEYVVYRSRSAGLDPAGCPFNLIPQNGGKLSIYANKECAAQLNNLRNLSPTVLKEEFLLDDTIYKVTYRVTEGQRCTDDCGAVSLVVIKRGINGAPDEVRKLVPAEVADAIMKAHTKAKRRAVLTHCGIGTNDMDDMPLVVPDAGEKIMDAEATVKKEPKTAKVEPKPEVALTDSKTWIGVITAADPKQSGPNKFIHVKGADGIDLLLQQPAESDKAAMDIYGMMFRELCVAVRKGEELEFTYGVSPKGNNLIQGVKPVEVPF